MASQLKTPAEEILKEITLAAWPHVADVALCGLHDRMSPQPRGLIPVCFDVIRPLRDGSRDRLRPHQVVPLGKA